MSSLEAISGFKLEINTVQNIIKDYARLATSGKTIILCWIPSHVNIRGNDRADTAAKSALSLPITSMKLRFCPTQQTSNWSFSPHSLLLIVWWWPPNFQSCRDPLTVKHILVKCANSRDICEKYFTVSSVAELFKSDYNPPLMALNGL